MIRLGLFFTYGATSKTWKNSGFLSRELIYYKYLKNFEIETTFFTYDVERDAIYANEMMQPFPVIPLLKSNGKLGRWVKSYFPEKRILQECMKLDVLKTNQMWGSWFPRRISKKLKKPFLLRCGYEALQNAKNEGVSKFKEFYLRKESKLSYSMANQIILTSPSSAEFVKNYFSIDEKRISVLSNYVNTELFCPMNLTQKNRVLFIGRFSREKNIEQILKACHQSKTAITLVGNGELYEPMKQLARSFGMEAEFLGNVEQAQLPNLLNSHRALILFSDYEGNPKVVLESMACGIPVIGSNVRGIRDLLKTEKNEPKRGVLTPKNSVEDLSHAIRNFMNQPNIHGAMGKQARDFAVDRASLQSISKNEAKLIKELYKKTV